MSRPKGSAGFTLIELLVTITLVAILAAIAVPSFSTLVRSNRVQALSEEFYSLLQYARTEAVTRGQGVTLTATDASQWNGALTVATATTTLRRQGVEGFNQPGITIVGPTAQLAFRANGALNGAALACFNICSTEAGNQICRSLRIQTSGRVIPPVTGTCP